MQVEFVTLNKMMRQLNNTKVDSRQLLSYFEVKSCSSYLDPNDMTNDCCSLALFSYFFVVPHKHAVHFVIKVAWQMNV